MKQLIVHLHNVTANCLPTNTSKLHYLPKKLFNNLIIISVVIPHNDVRGYSHYVSSPIRFNISKQSTEPPLPPLILFVKLPLYIAIQNTSF